MNKSKRTSSFAIVQEFLVSKNPVTKCTLKDIIIRRAEDGDEEAIKALAMLNSSINQQKFIKKYTNV